MVTQPEGDDEERFVDAPDSDPDQSKGKYKLVIIDS